MQSAPPSAALLLSTLFCAAASSCVAAAQSFIPAQSPLPARDLPALAPTAAQPAGATPQASAPAVGSAAPPPAHRARVDFSAGRLTIAADNASLNQILRDVAQATGMSITGGVQEERVFGTYGPADLGTVLTRLLAGTGSNLMLIQTGQIRQLILTARQGGPTPPSPSQVPEPFAQDDLPPQMQPHVDNRDPAAAPVYPPQPGPALPALQEPEASRSEPGATTTQQSPNGVKTPQQIYEELMKMQQQAPKSPK